MSRFPRGKLSHQLHTTNVIRARKNVHFQKNSAFDTPIFVNASGLYLQYDERMDKLLAHRIYDASPARMADIKIFAEIRKINGKEVSIYTLPELRALLEEHNTKVELVVFQEGSEQTLVLDLKELI